MSSSSSLLSRVLFIILAVMSGVSIFVISVCKANFMYFCFILYSVILVPESFCYFNS